VATVQRALGLLRQDEQLVELESLLAFFASFVLDSEVVRQIMAIEALEALGEALLDFTQPAELTRWLAHHSTATHPRQD